MLTSSYEYTKTDGIYCGVQYPGAERQRGEADIPGEDEVLRINELTGSSKKPLQIAIWLFMNFYPFSLKTEEVSR